MHNTCWPDTCSRGTEQQYTGHTPHSVGTHGHTKGGRREGAAGGLGAGHTNMNAWLYIIYTQGTAHSTATQRGGKVGRAGNQGGNTAEGNKKQCRCEHTHQQGNTQHIRCVTALREERGVCGCGLWGHGTSAVLGRSHYRHHRAMGIAWDGMGWGMCERQTERDPMQEREDEANGLNTRDVEGSAPQ